MTEVIDAATASNAQSAPKHRAIWVSAVLICVATIAVYWNSFDGTFVYDDIVSVRDNAHIRKLWPLREALSIDHWTTGSTMDGRPLLSLSFALNHALFGNAPWGYHLGNLLIHLACALLLFGIVRRTAAQVCRGKGAGMASGQGAEQPTALATGIALLWAVHPLQTESVTYIAQRAESLMACFYLLTLYAAVRVFFRDRSPSGMPWRGVAILACAAGMGVKEVMITAPIAVLLYDYVFVSRSFGKALRIRPGLYAGLAGGWVVTLVLVMGIRTNIGENYQMMPWLPYLFAQPGIVLHYVRLTAWPHPLVMDYNWPLAGVSASVILQTAAVGGILLLSLWALWRRHWAGFLGMSFFLVLAPSSSVLPNFQLLHLHRMYVPLAAVITLAVVGLRMAVRRTGLPDAKGDHCLLTVVCLAALCLGVRTHLRNRDYRSDMAFWQSNVDHRPASYVARVNLGRALQAQGQYTAAAAQYQQALQIKPDFTGAHYNLGVLLSTLGHTAQAITCYEAALRISPDYADAHNNLGNALQDAGRYEEAVGHYEQALRQKPGRADIFYNLGNALQAVGRPRDAVMAYQQALQIQPDYVDAHNNAGNVLLASGQAGKALQHYEQALGIAPDNLTVRNNLGNALQELGRFRESIVQYQDVLRRKPDSLQSHFNLGLALEAEGRPEVAAGHYRAALQIHPALAPAHHRLAMIHRQNGRLAEALRHLEEALRLQPDNAEIRAHLHQTRLLREKGSE